MPSDSTSASREWRFRLLLIAVSLVFSFAVAELGLRLLGLAAPPAGDAGSLTFFAYHPRLGWDLVAGATDHYQTPEFDIEIRITEQGLRAHRTFAATPPAGVRRLVVLGDSFTFGHGVEVEDAWPALLDAAGDDLEVVNLAVTGYGTDQQLLRFEQRLDSLAPDAVVLGLFVGNVFRNTRDEQIGYAKPHFVLENGDLRLAGVPVPETRPKASGSRLLRLASSGALSFAEHLGFGEAWPVTGAILDRLAARAAEHGAPLRVVILPKDQAIYGSGPRRALHERTLEAVHQLLDEHGLPYLDLTPALRRRAEAGGERLYFPRDGHWTVAGHRAAATAIDAWLRSLPPAAHGAPPRP